LIHRGAERIVTVSPDLPGVCLPGTAKLSKRFYDVLGEDVANKLVDWFNAVDLTYRTELRELNELNFARFEAKLEQRMADLRTELVRWMFAFWVTNFIGIAGLLIALRGH
jgi:hypothetical protein